MSNLIPLAWCVMVPRGATDADGLASLFKAIRLVETGGVV